MRGLFCLFLILLPFFSADAKTTFIFYYAWYGTPELDRKWRHWDQNGHHPPNDISSSYYPVEGAYSSQDPSVIAQHIRWISEAKVDVLIYSWWGRDDSTDRNLPLVMDAAAVQGLKVAFLIENYVDRTTESIRNDINYLNTRFAKHPAFYTLSRKTQYGGPGARGMFLLYLPDYSDEELRRLSNAVHKSKEDSILLIQSNDPGKIERTHADGIFLYDPVTLDNISSYEENAKEIKKHNDIYIPSVSPGFTINRLNRKKSLPFVARQQGETYDLWWEGVINANPEFVSIISFNEWHEGTQIEPAVRKSQGVRSPYLSYQNHYNKTAGAAQSSYLRRTAYWIDQYHQNP